MLKAYSVISDFSVVAQDTLKAFGISLDINNGERPDENTLIMLSQNYDILIIGAKERMTERVYSAATQLKIICTLSIGTDHISGLFKDSDRFAVINTPNANVISVAEHTFGLVLALKKRLLEGNDATINGSGREGVYRRPEDISGCTLGLIGAGKIAQQVCRIARAFCMKVLCYTFHPEKHSDMANDGVEFVTLEEALYRSDIISVHLPLTNETEKLIDADRVLMMRDNAVFINTSRSQIVDIKALMNKAATCHDFYVGLDIDIAESSELLMCKRRNVIVTPHIAGVSVDAINRMDSELANNLISFLSLKE